MIVKELLHRTQFIAGLKVHQLVLPKCRRLKILNMAHDSIFGGHLAFQKTWDGIKLSFSWPKMRKDISVL